MFVDYLEEALIAYTHREFDDLEEFFLRLVVIILCSWLNIKVCSGGFAPHPSFPCSILSSAARPPYYPMYQRHASTSIHSNRIGLGAR
jgi:hypothetical protein